MTARRRHWFGGRLFAGVVIGLGVLVVLFANTHLIYVAVTSQPECVDHLKDMSDTPGSFRAAKSSC